LLEGFGNLSTASDSLGVTRATLYKWINEDALQETVIEGRNARLDFAENKLDQNINNGDTTAIIFLLKTLGKDRGYVERQETKVEFDRPIFTGINLDVPENNSTSEDSST
jgi:hypothetical protein